MNGPRDKARFKTTLHDIFDAFKPRSSGSGPPAFIGAAYRDPLEHTTRRYVIDDIPAALGWDLGRLTQQVVEEARAQGDTTLFLDYLGVNPTTRVPLLIVEAKAWAKPLVTPSFGGAAQQVLTSPSSHEALIAKAIEHCKAGGQPNQSPVILEWAEWLHKLHQYVTTLHKQSGHVVQCLAITAGRWWVIFTDPYETFVARGNVTPANIRVIDERDAVARSDEIYEYLARQALINDPPDLIQPSHLSSYVAPADVARLFHALWIARKRDGAHFDAFPQINLYPAIVLERRDGQLISIIDSHRSRIAVPHDYSHLARHFQEVEASSVALLQTVNRELNTTLMASSLSDFPGFPTLANGRIPAVASQTATFLKSSPRPDEFLLATGTDTHYCLPHPTVDPCAGHNWSDCLTLRENKLSAPVVSRSFEPASFFTTLELHHCAHRGVHDRRQRRCLVSAFEEYLCCRACVFQDVCWPAVELNRLPCGFAARGSAAPQSGEQAINS
ncbi:hypothetical protein GGD63_006578 [Bradyrhizobium sp. cir1]|uniref:hypothetical protein n=1 Tax=Bradyrhizobium sp. cir1 TaxID=1445730 RepID=UPI001606BE07|nr:hypothetical protein [Bradyrhizobium sp. cir1]MBB4373750.1 hypothetical protein [Bradyrhizobium sp. cir1]